MTHSAGLVAQTSPEPIPEGSASLPTTLPHSAGYIHTPRRLLANGHCTRPAELDCRFQTMCEGCGFYQTSVEFIDILRRQRDDAASRADAARAKLYDELVRVIDATA